MMAQPFRLLEKSSLRQDDMIALMDRLTSRAFGGHNQQTRLQGDIDLLHAHGWLLACVPESAGGSGLSYQGASLDLAIDFLFRLGCANLALGRLFEGHVNACKLVYMLASPEQAKAVWDHVATGGFLGVWGADGRNPVTLNASLDANYLSGEKAFCSGLGSVSLAIVSARSAAGLQLILARVTDEARGDASQWQSSGMQATRSGTYDFENFPATHFTFLGSPDAYYAEPHFLGGQWRYLALMRGAFARSLKR
jgi:alkylation response protein AidB-like acyl-CoA dehydrogenase